MRGGAKTRSVLLTGHSDGIIPVAFLSRRSWMCKTSRPTHIQTDCRQTARHFVPTQVPGYLPVSGLRQQSRNIIPARRVATLSNTNGMGMGMGAWLPTVTTASQRQALICQAPSER
jgi:hypothetical protein